MDEVVDIRVQRISKYKHESFVDAVVHLLHPQESCGYNKSHHHNLYFGDVIQDLLAGRRRAALFGAVH